MTLQSQVDSDIKDAMRARETVRLNALRMLKAAMKNAAIEKGGAEAVLEDSEATAVIRKQIKQRQDSVEGFEKGGRLELAAAETHRMKSQRWLRRLLLNPERPRNGRWEP